MVGGLSMIYSCLLFCFLLLLSFLFIRLLVMPVSIMFGGGASYTVGEYVRQSVEFGAVRSTGFYYEPAFCALVLFAVMVSSLSLKPLTAIQYFLYFSAFAIVGSLSGILAFFCVLAVAVIKGGQLRRYVVYAYFLLPIFSFFCIWAFFQLVGGRINEFGSESSSSYYRVIAPLRIVYDVLANHPLGMPLGSMEQEVSKYFIFNGSSVGNTIDNGWYLLVFYFGYAGLLMAIAFFCYGFLKAVRAEMHALLLYVFMALSPFFTGAVFSPEFAFLMLVVVFSFKHREVYRG